MKKNLENKSTGGVNTEESAIVNIADTQFWG
jgi:hypothetical protein